MTTKPLEEVEEGDTIRQLLTFDVAYQVTEKMIEQVEEVGGLRELEREMVSDEEFLEQYKHEFAGSDGAMLDMTVTVEVYESGSIEEDDVLLGDVPGGDEE